ncbi:MAG: uracil-DNA glycosylase [Pseudomonadota bacterium]|nr:uracil-DNA glycosylase [Pseudomonadota bacterium]
MSADLAGLGGWSELPFFNESYPAIAHAVAEDPRVILPPTEQRLAALSLTPPEATRVVILGQDPYPTPGHAHGLAFSVAPDVRPLPRSLNNIFKELQDDVGVVKPSGDLRGWARQGVLLLNTVLSVPAGEANGHKALGWQRLAHEVLALSSRRPTAYILWGKQAQGLEKYIQPGDHLILRTAHPSPLSARRGFFGSRPFSTVNRWLTEQSQPTIDWNA